MSTPHSFVHRRNISIAWRTKKKKKEEEWKHGKNRGEKKIESKWMSTNAKWDAINFAYSDTTNTREDGGIWIK